MGGLRPSGGEMRINREQQNEEMNIQPKQDSPKN